jgi:hypothetical protein
MSAGLAFAGLRPAMPSVTGDPEHKRRAVIGRLCSGSPVTLAGAQRGGESSARGGAIFVSFVFFVIFVCLSRRRVQ